MVEDWKDKTVREAINRAKAETDSTKFRVGQNVVRKSDNVVCRIMEIRNKTVIVQDSPNPNNLKEFPRDDFYDPQIAADSAEAVAKDRHPSVTRPKKDIN